MGFFEALARLFQPLLDAVGLGPSQADSGIRKRLPFRNLRMALRQRIALARQRAYMGQQQKAMLRSQQNKMQVVSGKRRFSRRKMP